MWYLPARHERAAGGKRSRQGIRALESRAALGPLVGGARLFSLRGRQRQAAVLDGASAAQRHRLAAPRARADRHHRGRARALQAHERVQRLLDARNRSRGHRHADGGRARAAEEGGEVAPRSRSRGIPAARVGVEGGVGEPHRAAAPRAGGFARLGPRAVHHGRALLAGGAGGLRPPLRGAPALPRGAADQLVRQGRHRAQRSGSRSRGGREERAVQVRLSARRRVRRDRRRHHPSGDDARRHRHRGASRGRALQGNDRPERAPPHHRPRVPHHCRCGARRSEVRHRRRQGHAGAQFRGLRIRQAAPAAVHQHPQSRRDAERKRRTVPGTGPDQGARTLEGTARGARSRAWDRAAHHGARPLPAMQQHRRAAHVQAVVRQDQTAGGGGGRQGRRLAVRAGGLARGVPALAEQHP